MNSKFKPKPFIITSKGERFPISFREAKAEDSDFIRDLTIQSMTQHVHTTLGNDPQILAEYIKKNCLVPENTFIIRCNGKDIGRVAVTEADNKLGEYNIKNDTVKLHQLQLLPEYQSQGIGTKIIEQLISFADKQKKSLCLYVLKENPAKHLYEKLGFIEVGEENKRLIMYRDYTINQCRGISNYL